MFFCVGGGVISCADGWYILVFDSFNVCYNTKVHDIIKVKKEERDASKEDVTILHGLLQLVVLAIHNVVNHQHTRL